MRIIWDCDTNDVISPVPALSPEEADPLPTTKPISHKNTLAFHLNPVSSVAALAWVTFPTSPEREEQRLQR